MKSISARDKKFIWNAAGATFLVMALLQFIQPYVQGPDPQQGDIKSLSKHILPVTAHEVRNMLTRIDGKPVMLVLYASWCAPCQRSMPEVTALVREHVFGTVVPLFISLDAGDVPLAGYLVHHHYDQLFTPYRLKSSEINALQATLTLAGGHFSGIPYTAFFDAHGKAVAEFTGLVDKDRLLEMAASLP